MQFTCNLFFFFIIYLIVVKCNEEVVTKEEVCQEQQVEGQEDEEDDPNIQFLYNYAKKNDVQKLTSGVLYRVIEEGKEDAPRVQEDKNCKLRYIGTTINGDIFVSSRKKGQAASNVIPSKLNLYGWREAVSLMKEGDYWEVVVPPHLGYGEKSKGKYVKPGSTLIFELRVESASVAAVDLYSRQIIGGVFLLCYALYIIYQNQRKMNEIESIKTIEPKDLYNNPKHPTVFLKVSVGSNILEDIEIELFSTVCPKTVENFRCLVG